MLNAKFQNICYCVVVDFQAYLSQCIQKSCLWHHITKREDCTYSSAASQWLTVYLVSVLISAHPFPFLLHIRCHRHQIPVYFDFLKKKQKFYLVTENTELGLILFQTLVNWKRWFRMKNENVQKLVKVVLILKKHNLIRMWLQPDIIFRNLSTAEVNIA